MWWSGWLLVSWAVNLAIDGPVRVTSDTMLPAVRWMLMSAVVGMVLVWPVLRLAWAEGRHPAARAISDLVVLVLVFQVVIWPLRMLVDWTTAQAVMINLAIAVWALPIGLWVCLGLRSGPTGRTVAMAACVVTLAGPALARLVFPTASPFAWTVWETVWFISDPLNTMAIETVTAPLAGVCGVSCGGWVLALGQMLARSPLPGHDSASPNGYHGVVKNDRRL